MMVVDMGSCAVLNPDNVSFVSLKFAALILNHPAYNRLQDYKRYVSKLKKHYADI